MKHFKSTLEKIAEQVFTATDFWSARTIFIDYVSGTNVKDKDKMISEVEKMKTLVQIQKYTANALLKFEGLSTSEKPSK